MDNNATQHVSSQVETVNVHDSGIAYVGCTINVTNSTIRQTHGHLTDSSSLPSIIEDASLREYYIDTLCLAAPLPWYPDYTWNIEEIYTDLAIEGSEQRFPLEDLFTQAQKRYKAGGFFRILIEGDAGYGKSTLTLKLASDWANRNSHDKYNYLKHFDLLLKTRLGLVEENEDLLSHLKNIYEEKINVSLDDVLKGRGERQVLIVLDGYDESKPGTKKLVGKILEKSLWSKCHLIVTSRFGHVPKQIKGKTFCVTVKGYGVKQIAVAVGKFFIKSGHVTKEDAVRYSLNETKQEDFEGMDDAIPFVPEKERLVGELFETFLRNVLRQSPYKDLAQCPLLCAMMCCLIGEFPDRQLPETLSGLYFAMINRNLCRTAAKRAIADGDDPEEWNWDLLKDKFRKDHHDYLKEFGLLCLHGLRKNNMLFTLFQLTGNDEVAKPNDPKISRLVEAGVVIQSFGETCNTVYQAPHRTIAEFLAAYYLSNEGDLASVELSLLDLFAKDVSYKKVFEFCFEMKSEQNVINAFRDIKFPKDFLDQWTFLSNYLSDPKILTRYWSQVQPALPHITETRGLKPCLRLLPQYYKKLRKIVLHFQHDIAALAETEPVDDLFQLIKNNVDVTIGYGHKTTSPVSGHPALFLQHGINNNGSFVKSLPLLVYEIVRCGVRLGSLTCVSGHSKFLSSVPANASASTAVVPILDLQEAVITSLKLLLESKNCPANLAFDLSDNDVLVGLIDALNEPSNSCTLKSLELILANSTEIAIEEKLCRVLAEYWLPNKLEHLTLSFGSAQRSSGIIGPIVHGFSLSQTLRSLDLSVSEDLSGQELKNFIMGVLGSQLESLRLTGMNFMFTASDFSKYTERSSCRLKSLSLNNVTLKLLDPQLFDGNMTPLALEKLSLDHVTVVPELLDWLCTCLRSVRVVALAYVKRETPRGTKESYTIQLLDTLTRTNNNTLEELHFSALFLDQGEKLMLLLIRKSLERCPRIHTVMLNLIRGQLVEDNNEDNGEDDNTDGAILPSRVPAAFLVEDELGSLDYNDIWVALYETVLNVPELQTMNLPVNKYPIRQGFCEAIADRAAKWPGRDLDNSNVPRHTLTLHGFKAKRVAHIVTVVRQRKLDVRIECVGDEIYEIWFPASSASPSVNKE